MYLLPLTTLEQYTSHPSLTTREALSGVFGAISLTCWIFLLLPQLIENYRNQSAEAISLAFVCVWFIGDVTNLLGGLWADLVPTIVAIAVYFCITDGVLISQCLYYGIRNRRREGRSWLEAARGSVSITGDEIPPMNGSAGADAEIEESGEADGSRVVRSERTVTTTRTTSQQNTNNEDDEEQPLLKRTRSSNASYTGARRSSVTIPGSTTASPILHRRRSSANSQSRRRHSSTAAANDHLAKIFEEQDRQSGSRLWLKNVLSVVGVLAIGAAGWYLAYQSGAWKPAPAEGHGGNKHGGDEEEEHITKGAQILGYISAVAYLGARIPQIIKNWREQSCEGLSLLFFIFSLLGNLTYGASILFHSTDRAYVVKNVPWLIGSLGTMAEDVTIFVQFHLYKDQVGLEESVFD